jgi:hypothetical protein
VAEVVEQLRWTEETLAKENPAEVERALAAALRARTTVTWPVAGPVGEVRTQAIRAEPDGTWTLVRHVDQEPPAPR